MGKNMWMVRAGEGAYRIEDFRRKKYVAIGWNRIKDVSKIKNREEVKQLILEKYPENKKYQNIVSAGQFSRFLLEFKTGDYVLSYDPDNREYLVGELIGDYEYNSTEKEYSHTRKVRWLGKVSRDKLSISTRNTLGAICTIFKINDIAQNEIISVLEEKKETKDVVQEEMDEEGLKEDMVSKAHELIKDEVLDLDWEDMEKLVAGILRAIGYKTMITERGADRGRDIEASKDGLMLEEPRIIVEVKHRSGQIGAKEIRNFNSVLRGQKGLYISTGGFSKEAKYEAERTDEQLTLIDSDRLVKLIIQNYDDFDVDTKLLIPLSKIYWPI